MGCNLSKKSKNSSAGLKDTAIILASQTSFTVNEVEALYILYKKLSSSIVDDGLIHREELQLALLGSSRRNNLFVDRVFHLFDVKQNGVIEFEEFVRSLNIFHPKTPQAYKVAFAFDLYDLRHTGYIERQELKQMVMAILEESNLSLSDDHVKVILDKTFIEADSKGDGRIDHEEWNEFVNKNPSLIKNMTLPYLKDVSTGFPSFLISTEVQDSDITIEKDGVATTEKTMVVKIRDAEV